MAKNSWDKIAPMLEKKSIQELQTIFNEMGKVLLAKVNEREKEIQAEAQELQELKKDL